MTKLAALPTHVLILALVLPALASGNAEPAPATQTTSATPMSEWREQHGETDGERFLIRVLRKLPDKSVQKRHPHRLILGLAYDEEGSLRMPTDAEWQQIDAYARAFNAAAEQAGAVSVASLTSDGFHQYIFYCEDAAKAHLRLMGALAEIPAEDRKEAIAEIWEVTDERDASWSYVRRIAAGP
jgi:hypothetical protein